MTTCNKCGMDILNKDLYCSNCGAEISLKDSLSKKTEFEYKKIPKNNLVISFIVILSLDAIGISVLFSQFFDAFSFNKNSLLTQTPFFLLVGLIVGILEAVILESQLKFLVQSKLSKFRRMYLYIPTFHALFLITLLIVANILSPNNYFNFMTLMLANFITGELIIGFFFMYYRFTVFMKTETVHTNYQPKESDSHEEKVRQQKNDEKNKQERMYAKAMVGFKF